MNPDYSSDARRIEPLPLSSVWERPPSSQNVSLMERSSGYDRYNGNQPVYPLPEQRHFWAGGDLARKRPHTDFSLLRPKIPRFSSVDALQEESRKSITEINQELGIIESAQIVEAQYLSHARRLLNDEIEKITANSNPDWINIESPTPIKVRKRILLPKPRPGANVVGRLMGVGGQTLRKMCHTYKCHVSICGAGSVRSRDKEAELLQSGDAAHKHLKYPLHAEVWTTAVPHIAYSRLAQVLTLIHKIIFCKERFEHDGLVFEANSSNRFGHTDGNVHDQREDRSFHPTRERGRFSPPRRYLIDPSWNEEPVHSPDEHDVKKEEPNTPAIRGGRGGRGKGFVPRAGIVIPRPAKEE